MFHLRLILLTVFFSCTTACLVSQTVKREVTDVLLKKLPPAKNPQDKVNLLNKLSRGFRDRGIHDSSLYYGLQAKKLSEQLAFEKGMIDAYLNLGTTHREMNNFTEAIAHLKLLLKLCEKKGDKIGEGDAYDNMGHIYFAQGNTALALENHLLALKIRRNAGDQYGIGNSCDNIAQIYAGQSNYLKSVEYFEASLKVFEKMGEKSRIALSAGNIGNQYYFMANLKKALQNLYKALELYKEEENEAAQVWVYNLIANIYCDSGEHERALENYHKSMKINKKLGDQQQTTEAYTLLGRTYLLMKNYDEALRHIQKAMDLSIKYNYPERIMVSHYFFGQIYQAKNQDDKVLKEIKIALEMATEMNDRQWMAACTERIGRVYFKLKDFKEAKKWLNRGLELNKEIFTMQELSSNYEILSQVDRELGNYKEAYHNYRMHIQFKDSLQKNDATKLALKYEFKKKEVEARTKQEKKDLKTAEELHSKNLQRNTAFVGLTLMSLLAVALFYLFRLRNKKLETEKQNLKLKRREVEAVKATEQFKSQFLANISHEFRTPLTLISGHLEILKQKGNEKDLARYEEMDYNGKRLLQLINQLLDLSKMESGQYTLQYKNGNILNELQAHVQTFHSYAQQLDIDLTLEITAAAQSRCDAKSFCYSSEALATLVGNLLSNALKFTPKSGNIHTRIDFTGEKLLIAISDTGPGIPEADLNKIFDRFYQVESLNRQLQTGSGIGLALVKELAMMHGGDASAENGLVTGCTFSVSLSSMENTDQFTAPEAIHVSFEVPKINDFKAAEDLNEELPLLLIVEDQEQLRQFIRECFENQYRFAEASDGLQGIELAKELLPDLIISDVMMPEANGFELCDALKNNLATSHIPIILLTAKADQSDKEKGLDIGADDYLTKPFSVAELKLRVRNMMRLRQLLRQKLVDGNIPLPEDAPELCDRDREFLQTLTSTTEKNIANTQFGVTQLAEAVFLSASQLTRKLKALTGYTPADFIRNIRLQKALKLLELNASVADVAWAIGFEDPSYFGKVFKKHFGVPPSEIDKLK